MQTAASDIDLPAIKLQARELQRATGQKFCACLEAIAKAHGYKTLAALQTAVKVHGEEKH